MLETKNQRTYLVATKFNVYKVIDDRRSERPKVAWSRPKETIAPGNKIKIYVEGYKARTDKLVIESLPDKTNLVTKKLFANIELSEALDKLLKDG